MLQLPAIPQHSGNTFVWGQLYGSAKALAIAETAKQFKGLSLVLVNNAKEAWQLEANIKFFLGIQHLPILQYPCWETLPYDIYSPHQDIISERLNTLYQLPQIKQGLLILSTVDLLQRVSPKKHLNQQIFIAKVGDHLNIDTLRTQLKRSGYNCVPQVLEHGQFAVHGSLIDLYPMGHTQPYRISLFNDKVESIRDFNLETQRSANKHEKKIFLPAREFPIHEQAIKDFRKRWRDRFEYNPQNCIVYNDINDNQVPAGIEYYLPLFFNETATLFDYLPSKTLVFETSLTNNTNENFWEQLIQRHEQRRHNTRRPILKPEELYLRPKDSKQALAAYPHIQLQSSTVTKTLPDKHNFSTLKLDSLQLQIKKQDSSTKLYLFTKNCDKNILFITESTGRREKLLELLRSINIHPKQIQNLDELATQQDTSKHFISVAPLFEGLDLPQLTIITENQIYGEAISLSQKRRKNSKQKDIQSIINNLDDLFIGAPVVHEQSGVGRYQGLKTLQLENIEHEFLTIEYANKDKLYVPVNDLHLVNRFTGASPESAPLHKLGSDTWGKQKVRAQKQAQDVAAELLSIHAKRAAKQGHQFKLPTMEYKLFSSSFPFEETADQRDTINVVLEDMQKNQPMDRVVCGDVGFGKTEVAMRAAFMASMNQKQVCLLVPTTLLAQQHYENFQNRFADWPLRIECLSRFSSKKKQNSTITALGNGKIDIIIGTHKLLQPSIKFHDLGLVIIDEEQRFGVRHKEIMKQMRAEVDILTLTATPIPRTLNMSMNGLRDLSIIATPPQHRTAIKTFISEWNDDQIREVCQRELSRNGQIYFVHNKVENITKITAQIKVIIPEAHTAVAHGKMSERDLEKVMLDFYHQRVNLLVCTTIIESGIDVPTANTIIINRADHFGLSQLYQMRGRVGRSHHRAYAYLITPHEKSMSPDATKRLQAIESLEDLGAGFTLAIHDLEIRGAGELLGSEQSGQIQEVGFNMYTNMLDHAVQALKNGVEFQAERSIDSGPQNNLGLSSLLPTDYVPDVHMRLILYKRISNAENLLELEEMKIELIDRFGLLPNSAKNLLKIAQMKLSTLKMGIGKINASKNGGRMEFTSHTTIDPSTLIMLIQQNPTTYHFNASKNTLHFKFQLETAEERFKFIFAMLNTLNKKPLNKKFLN